MRFLLAALCLGVVALGVGGCPWPQPEPGTLTVDTEPVKGEVSVDGENWGTAPQTREVTADVHLVTFGAVAGYRVPADAQVTVPEAGEKTVLGTYVKDEPLPPGKSQVLFFLESQSLENLTRPQQEYLGSLKFRKALEAKGYQFMGVVDKDMRGPDGQVTEKFRPWFDILGGRSPPRIALRPVGGGDILDFPLPADEAAVWQLLGEEGP